MHTMGATWVATPNTRQHDAYYQRQYVEGLTRSGTSPNTLEQCQTDWQWLGRVGATLGRGWAMGALPIGHIGFWLAKSNVGVWSCGRQITGVISRLRAPDRKSWPRLGNWAVRGPSCNPPAGHCKRIRRVCFILHFTNTRQNKLPKWPPFRVKKVSPNRRNKGGWAPAPTVRGTGGGGAGRHE